jgi:hypothetical protein
MRATKAALRALIAASVFLAGCQTYDRGAASGPQTAQTQHVGGSCPVGEVCSTPADQCAYGSPECFYLCGSPSCALADAAIPPELTKPPIYLPDGAVTTDPCEAVREESLLIREQSCTPCHSGEPPAPSKGPEGLNYILDDGKLATSVSPDYRLPDGGGKPYVVPGDPLDSFIYQRVVAGEMPMPRNAVDGYIGAKAGASIVYPTPSDISVLYEWIRDCVPGANPTANSSNYYGGCFGPCSDDDAATETAPFADAAVNAAVDAAIVSTGPSSGASDAGTVDEPAPTDSPCGSTVLVPQRAYASSVQGQGNTGGALLPASLAIDGNLGTRWGSLFASPEWITVDYGAPVFLDQVQILWETACASAYDIEVSNDAITWRTAKSVTGNTSESMNPPADWSGADSEIGFALVARYLRINGTTRCLPSDGYSIWEMRAWGDTNATCSPE